MPRGKKSVTASDVYDELVFRDRREHPVLTVSELADRIDEASRRTVKRRVDELVDQGKVRERRVGNASLLWVIDDENEGVCPDCGGPLTKDDEYDPGYACRSCGAPFGQLADADGKTKYGTAVERGSRALYWWTSLPPSFREEVAEAATQLIDDPPEDFTYRPENIRIDDDELPDASDAFRRLEDE